MANNSGLVAYYSFDEGAGNVLHDLSGGGNHGTLVNSPTWVNGIRGKALRFNGNNQYIVTSARQGPQNGATFSTWVNLASSTSNYGIVMQYNVGGSAYCQFFTFNGNIYARIHQIRDSIRIGRTTTGGIKPNVWQHFLFVWDGGTSNSSIKIYINGIQSDTTNDGSGSFTAPYSGSDVPLWIGAQNAGPNSLTNGLIDEVRIYNRALSQSEITDLYNESAARILTPSNAGLVGYWSFDEGAGTVAHDLSGGGNHGTLVNNPLWVNGIKGKALKFNGSNQCAKINSSPGLQPQFLTVSLWLKLAVPLNAQSASFPLILDKYELTGYFGYRMLFDKSSNYLIFGTLNGATSRDATMGNASNALGTTWHHVTGTFDGIATRLYVDSILIASVVDSSSILYNNENLFLGCYDGTALFTDCLIDEVRIYNRALSQEEITSLYQTGATKLLS